MTCWIEFARDNLAPWPGYGPSSTCAVSLMLPFQVYKFVLFQIVPWVGVMAAGYAFGKLYEFDAGRRIKIMFRLGMVLTIAFILLRATNLYGNPPVGLGGVSQGDWHVQPTVEKTIILFLDVEKYPPSLQFLLMTMGPSLLLLAWLERSNLPRWTARWSRSAACLCSFTCCIFT